jgi:hypothetical protein
MEEVYDLLASKEKRLNKLAIYDEMGKPTVRGKSTWDITSKQDVMNKIRQGQQNRHVGATKMNEQSSRAHTIF